MDKAIEEEIILTPIEDKDNNQLGGKTFEKW